MFLTLKYLRFHQIRIFSYLTTKQPSESGSKHWCIITLQSSDLINPREHCNCCPIWGSPVVPTQVFWIVLNWDSNWELHFACNCQSGRVPLSFFVIPDLESVENNRLLFYKMFSFSVLIFIHDHIEIMNLWQ